MPPTAAPARWSDRQLRGDQTQRDIPAARQCYEQALDVLRELGDRRTEGQALGYVGLLHAREGRAAEARERLHSGEALLAKVDEVFSRAILLCGRAEAEHLAGDPSGAQATLERVRALAHGLHAGDESELGRALTRMSELLKQ